MASLNSTFDDPKRSSELSELFTTDDRDVEWVSLTDSITNEVDGLDLSVDFLSSHSLSSVDDSSMPLESSIQYSSLVPRLHIIPETCESSSLDEGDGDIETEAFTETPEELLYIKKEHNSFLSRHHRKPSTNAQSLKRVLKSQPTPSTSESNNSDSSIQSSTSLQSKRKAGWPKGRKRKPPEIFDLRPPKAPSTGYVLYSIEKRKNYKHIPFHEVTKLLGNEWTKLDKFQKKVYLDRAENDKKRYREELRAYRKSDAYQTYLKWKRSKRRTNGTEESDIDATDELDEEDNDELYCKLCDQWFVSFHNKKEHLAGKQHLAKCKQPNENTINLIESSSSYSFDDSSQDIPTTLPPPPPPAPCDDYSFAEIAQNDSTPSNMEENMNTIFTVFADRENEISYLKTRIRSMEQQQKQLKSKIAQLESRKMQLNKLVVKSKEEEKFHRPLLLKFWSILSIILPNTIIQTSAAST